MTKKITKKEYDLVKETLQEFLDETTAPYSLIEPWNIINKYFVIDNEVCESPIIDLKVWDKLYSLWAHSTLDTTDAKNFITYARILCRNLLIWPIKV